MYAARRKYFLFRRKLKDLLFRELVSNTSKYDENDELSQELFEPMFNSIIDGMIHCSEEEEIQKVLTKAISYYGVGKENDVFALSLKIQKDLQFLRSLYKAAMNEQTLHKDTEKDLSIKQRLSSELDEYLRIGEELSKQG